MRTKVKGRTWCSTCNKIQPSNLTSLVSYDTFQEVRGTCVVCNQSVSKRIEKRKKQSLKIAAKPASLSYKAKEEHHSTYKRSLVRLFTFAGVTYVIFEAFGYVMEAVL